MNIEQAREVSSRIWAAGYTDESAAIDSLIAELAQLEREMVAATIRIDNDAIELAALKGQQPVAWVDVIDRYEGPYNFHGKELIDSGKHSLFLAAGAQEVSHDAVEFRQFLSDALTAAGLVEHGKQSKGLAERLATGVMRYRAAPVQAGAQPVQQDKLQTCNCRWDGDAQVQQCTLHEAHVDAIHEWAERAKTAEVKLKALQAQERKPLQVLMITTAYEQGVGKGHQAHGRGVEIACPYTAGECSEAWELGYQEGKKQASPKVPHGIKD